MIAQRRSLTMLLAVGAMGVLTGCFNPFSPKIADNRGISEPAPIPNSPRNLMLLFAWCYEKRAVAEYREIFTDDYRFAFAATDSAGNAFQDRALTRDEELESTTNLFIGGSASEPPANRITLELDPNIVALPDSRPGKTDPWHKEISTNVVLSIETNNAEFRVLGRARFFVVRGDSALIPQELLDRGFGPDPNRWYLERWEDETAGNLAAPLPIEGSGSALVSLGRLRRAARAATHARPDAEARADAFTPTLDVTWGALKAQYYGTLSARPRSGR